MLSLKLMFPQQELESPSYPYQGLESSNFLLEELRTFQIRISNAFILNMEKLRPQDGGPRSLDSQIQVPFPLLLYSSLS